MGWTDEVGTSLDCALNELMSFAGQVIVIGATNRPDAVDSALRRPGRFDREFYFPLPNRTARKEIIGINTREWDPKLSDEFLDQLAILTKGYGGADLRVNHSPVSVGWWKLMLMMCRRCVRKRR